MRGEIKHLQRTLGTTQALVLLNNDRKPRTLRLPLPAGQRWNDALAPGVTATVNAQSELTLTVPPLFGRVLIHTAK